MLRRSLMSLLIGGPAVLLLAIPGPALAGDVAAQSGVEVVAWTGHGTMSPGLTTTPTFQTSFTFITDAVIYVGQATGAAATCNFNGASRSAETSLTGAGAGSMNCGGGSPASLTLAGYVNYIRTGETLTLTGALNGPDGVPSCTVEASAVTLEPTSVPAFTSFRHQGFMVLACT